MLVLTIPIIFPLIVEMGFNPIWFGVVIVIVLEMGLISPPVGVNVFVVKSIAENVPIKAIFVGILPFWIAMGVCLVILVLFPEIATFLPAMLVSGAVCGGVIVRRETVGRLAGSGRMRT